MRGIVELAAGVHQVAVQPGVNAWVLRDAAGVTLIDSGLDGPGLLRGVRRLGVAVGDIRRVLLTHGHPDHTGGLPRLRRAGVGDLEVAVGTGDLATVRGLAPQPTPDPSTWGGRVVARLPEPPGFRTVAPWPQATALLDGDHLDVAGGIDVVATPGHSPGHVAFHLTAHDVAIGGDALFNVFRLRPSPAFLCSDVPANRQAIATLAGLGVGTLALAHGRPVTGDVDGRLREHAARA